MKPIETVIFDMDGLMIDSEPIQLKAVNDALKPLQLSVSEAQFIDIVGQKSIENFAHLKQKYGFTENIETLEQNKNKAYKKRIQQELKPMPGLYQALDLCKENNINLALASSSIKADIDMVLKILGLENTFAAMVSGDEVKKGKPDPAIFLKALEKLDIEPSRVAVLEDTAHGINGAKTAGMMTIAIPNRFTARQDFSNADIMLESLTGFNMEILYYLASGGRGGAF